MQIASTLKSKIRGIPLLATHKLLTRMARRMARRILACALVFLVVAVRQSCCALYENTLHERAVLGDLDHFKETLSHLRSQGPWNGSEGLQVGGFIVVSLIIQMYELKVPWGVQPLVILLLFYCTRCRIYSCLVTHLKTLHVAIPN